MLKLICMSFVYLATLTHSCVTPFIQSHDEALSHHDVVNKEVEEFKSETSKALGDSYEFYYIYLGDIIELALKNSGFYGFLKEPSPPYRTKSYIGSESGKDYNMTNMRFLLGPLEYLDKQGKIRLTMKGLED